MDDLFDFPKRHHRHRKEQRDTSLEAYARSEPVADSHGAKILAYLRDIRPRGATKDQIARNVELTDVQVARQMASLERDGLVEDTGERGRTPSDRPAIIWRAKS